MPTIASWIRDGSHRLGHWEALLPSTTPASQAGILHGNNDGIPNFRWYEKDRGEVMVCNRPTSAAELQRRAVERTGDGGLLTVDGDYTVHAVATYGDGCTAHRELLFSWHVDVGVDPAATEVVVSGSCFHLYHIA